MTHRPAQLSRRSFLMASAAVALVSACATQTGSDTVPPASLAPTMTSLLAAQAVPIRNLAPNDPGVKALAKRLAGARMAGLGEATHGSHEDVLLKSVLIQAMVENHNLRVVLLEANSTGCAQLDTFASGAPTGLLAAEAVKQAPVFRILKTEVMADLLAWLRGWNAVNADRPVRVIGVDCQASSQDAGGALAALATIDSGAADVIGAALAPILTADARAARHDLMLKQITSAQRAGAEAACRMLEAELNAAGLEDAAFNARRAWQGLIAFEHETSDGDLNLATPEYWSRRDVLGAQHACRRREPFGRLRGLCTERRGAAPEARQELQRADPRICRGDLPRDPHKCRPDARRAAGANLAQGSAGYAERPAGRCEHENRLVRPRQPAGN
jgi:hypothetical protein